MAVQPLLGYPKLCFPPSGNRFCLWHKTRTLLCCFPDLYLPVGPGRAKHCVPSRVSLSTVRLHVVLNKTLAGQPSLLIRFLFFYFPPGVSYLSPRF